MSATLEGARPEGRDGLGMLWRVAAATVAAAAVLLVAPGGAAAATTCERVGTSAVLEVTMTAGGDDARIGVTQGGAEIFVLDSQASEVDCTGDPAPTVNNTDAISVHNASGLNANRVTIFEASRLAPGLTGESGDDEIEILVNLNGGSGGELEVSPILTGGSMVFGTGGINPNATPGEVEPDADIIPSDVPTLAVVGTTGAGNPGPDRISAQGGAGTGGPLPGGIALSGGDGSDTLIGGDGGDNIQGGGALDQLIGFEGGDVIDGGQGDNVLSGGGGNDRLVPGSAGGPGVSGGSGVDELDYSVHLTTGVSIDLDSQHVGIENVIGTNFADVLRGDGVPNGLLGLQGNDVLEGRGGDDALGAGPGDDSLDVRDGGPDAADCGPDLDTLTADAAGIDTLTGCENVLFPAPPGPGAGGGSAGGGGEPPNDFTLGKVRKNKKRGTAKLTVEVGGPGALDLGGKSVKPASKEVATAGEVKLKIKAKGQKKAKLNQKGKTKVKPAVTYTPSGGTSNTQDITVKLIKR